MGSTSLQIKNFIGTAYDFQSRRTDKNLNQVQRHLQILSMVSDLKIFEPASIETMEFYVCLEKFLKPSECKSGVSMKVIGLLAHISRSPSIRVALRDDIKIVPVLSDYLLESRLNKDKTLKTLKLIEEISYRLKIERSEAWMLKFVPYLVDHIIEGVSGDDLLVPALTTLANLCRSNPPILSCLRNCRKNKALVQKLTDMRTATINIKLLASELLFYLDLKVLELDFALIEHIVDLIFTAASDGFMENNVTWLRLAADVFGELVSCPRVEGHLREYKKYADCLKPLITNMVSESPDILIEVMLDLMCHFIQLDHPDIQPFYMDILSKVINWMHSEQCGVASVKVVQCLITHGDDTIISTLSQDFIAALKMSLDFDEDVQMNRSQLHRISATLTLVEGLCSRDTAMRLKLALEFQPAAFSSLLKRVMSIEASSLSQKSTTCLDYETSISGSRSQQEIPALTMNDLSANLMETIAQTVVIILTVVKVLGTQNAEYLLEYSQMVNNPSAMTHLVRCERSSIPEFVARAVALISEGSVPNESMGALVKAVEEANSSTHPSQSMEFKDPKTKLFGIQQYSQLFSPTWEENVDNMIELLRGTVVKMELKDCALTDVMEMYEYKMAAMTHMEISLQNALTAADAQNRQTQHSLLQTKMQNDHAMRLLCAWEERLQVALKEKSEVQASISQIQSSARQLRDNFRKEKTDMERKNLDLQKDLSGIRESLEAREEKIRKLQRQLSDAQNEIKHACKQIKEEQEKQQKLQDQNQKLEEEVRKGRRDYEELQKENQRVEKMLTQQKKENSELELLVRSHEEAMSAKEEELEEMTKKYNELKRIQDMIHNISAGKLGF